VRQHAEAKKGDRHTLRLSKARYLIGGRATYRKIAEAILAAEHEIFVLGWWITPHIPLVREGEPLPGNVDPRLSRLLRSAAERGVRVFVLIFHETGSFVPNDSEWAEAELRHPNVFVARHRSRFDINRLWSHHEKVVVVDQQLAFVGGIDLCLGRYEDADYRLRDTGGDLIWDGQDYSNPRIRDFADVRSAGARDILDRRSQPRMPWQDVSCALLGRAARDVARHCIERWNHAKSMRPQYANMPTVLLHRKVNVCNDRLVDLVSEAGDESWPSSCGSWHECTAQVVRSVGRWSAGTRSERSAHAAYCDLVQGAERFVFIENQFFVSGLDGDSEIGNRVAEAIYRRIVKAHEKQERFHVMVVMPLLPALDGPISSSSPGPPLYVMYWQYRSFRNLRQSLLDAGVDAGAFLSVYGLRTHAVLEDGSPPVAEEIYVHSKVMVVDDRLAIIGSANINDRSLMGSRDSELSVVLRDSGHAAHPDGLAAQMRKAFFARYLGWSAEDIECKYQDPASEACLGEIKRVARNNTEIYEELFGALPSDSIRSWAELASRRAERADDQTASASYPSSPRAVHSLEGDFTRVPTPENTHRLSDVQGHLVEWPIDFLAEEDLSPAALSVGGLAPDCFT
jgi:phospholipase D1/2